MLSLAQATSRGAQPAGKVEAVPSDTVGDRSHAQMGIRLTWARHGSGPAFPNGILWSSGAIEREYCRGYCEAHGCVQNVVNQFTKYTNTLAFLLANEVSVRPLRSFASSSAREFAASLPRARTHAHARTHLHSHALVGVQVAQKKTDWPAIPCVRAFGRDVKAYMKACKGDAKTGMR